MGQNFTVNPFFFVCCGASLWCGCFYQALDYCQKSFGCARKCGRCWNEETSFCMYRWACNCFFSIRLSNNPFEPHAYIIISSSTYMQNAESMYACNTFIGAISFLDSIYSPYPYIINVWVGVSAYALHTFCIAPNKKGFHSNVFGSVDLLFSRLAFFRYYLFIFALVFCYCCALVMLYMYVQYILTRTVHNAHLCKRKTSSFNLILDKNVLTTLLLNAINVVTYISIRMNSSDSALFARFFFVVAVGLLARRVIEFWELFFLSFIVSQIEHTSFENQ